MEVFAKQSIGRIAERALALVRDGHFRGIALRGNLGAGKTTLTQEIARTLGVTEQVISPTFVLLKRYEVPPSTSHSFSALVHVDAYRFETEQDCAVLKVDSVPKGTLLIVEWPERCGALLPTGLLDIELVYVDEENRGIVGL
jgi:tRNA threonylcarbamoyladenosine biosynthesis protein TsaE